MRALNFGNFPFHAVVTPYPRGPTFSPQSSRLVLFEEIKGCNRPGELKKKTCALPMELRIPCFIFFTETMKLPYSFVNPLIHVSQCWHQWPAADVQKDRQRSSMLPQSFFSWRWQRLDLTPRISKACMLLLPKINGGSIICLAQYF